MLDEAEEIDYNKAEKEKFNEADTRWFCKEQWEDSSISKADN